MPQSNIPLPQEVNAQILAGNYSLAAKTLAFVEKNNGRSAATLAMAIRIKLFQDETKKAIKMANSWLEKNPEDVLILDTIGNIFVNTNEINRAINVFSKAELLTPNPKRLTRISELTNTKRQLKLKENSPPAVEKITKKKPKDKSLKEKKGFSLPKIQKNFSFTNSMPYVQLIFHFILLHIIIFQKQFLIGVKNHPFPEHIKQQAVNLNLNWIIEYSHWIVVPLLPILFAIILAVKDRKLDDGFSLVFSGYRKLYSYHFLWLGLLISLMFSLYFNSIVDRQLANISADFTFGFIIVLITLIFIPFFRNHISLQKNTINPRINKIVISKVFPIPDTKVYYPRDISNAELITKKLSWLLTGTREIKLKLKNGSNVYLIAPASPTEMTWLFRQIKDLMNEAINPISGAQFD